MVLTAEQRSRIAWTIDYLEKSNAINSMVDAKVVEELARVFGGQCNFSCGCPGEFSEGMRDCLGCTLLEVLLCVDEGVLTAAQRATVEWTHDYLELANGPSGTHFDPKAAEELSRVFGQTCGQTCGCHGSFMTGLRDSPVSTLLRMILCVSLASERGVGVEAITDVMV